MISNNGTLTEEQANQLVEALLKESRQINMECFFQRGLKEGAGIITESPRLFYLLDYLPTMLFRHREEFTESTLCKSPACLTGTLATLDKNVVGISWSLDHVHYVGDIVFKMAKYAEHVFGYQFSSLIYAIAWPHTYRVAYYFADQQGNSLMLNYLSLVVFQQYCKQRLDMEIKLPKKVITKVESFIATIPDETRLLLHNRVVLSETLVRL